MSFASNAVQWGEENPEPPPQPSNSLAIAPTQEVQSLVQYREEPQRYRQLSPDTGDVAYDAAIRANPSMRNTWIDHEAREFTESFSFGQAIGNSIRRDSFLGNSIRVLDQTIAELSRTDQHAVDIWDARRELTLGISDEYHEHILNSPTIDLAIRESQRIRRREMDLKREYNTGIGKSLAADLAGFMIDPSNYLPGMAIVKGISLARRTNSMGLMRGVAASSKGEKMATFAAIGAFEEAIRMAPRYASDPTFETNNYMEGIAMSAAFSGILPAAFGGVQAGLRKLPALNDDMQATLHNWGMDVAVRQAMRFPSALKETGFKDPGTALRKSKEHAQDRVGAKVKEFNKTRDKREFNEALKQDMAGDAPNTERTLGVLERRLDQAGDVAINRLKIKFKRLAIASGATSAATVLAGPAAGVAVAAFFANKDYLAAGMKLALKHKRQRRIAYDAAISAGDTEAAAAVLRSARVKPTVKETVQQMEENILESVAAAKQKIRDINAKAKVCS